MISNHARVGRALYLLKIDLDTFIPREFLGHHQDEGATVLNQILGQSRDPQKPFRNMKTQDLLAVMQASWQEVFEPALSGIDPALLREVAFAHEAWANRQSFSADFAFQTLTSIQRLLSAMSSPSTLELEMLKVESLESAVGPLESEESGNAGPAEAGPAEANTTDADVPQPPPAAVEPNLQPETVAEMEESGAALETVEPDPPSEAEEPYLAELVQVLRRGGALQDQDQFFQATRPSSQPEYADPSAIADLNPGLAQVLASLGVEQLPTYQANALAESLSGSNVAMSADWGSDESLSYAVPLAETLLRNQGGHGLVLCPDDETARRVCSSLEKVLPAVGLDLRCRVEGAATPDIGSSPDDSPVALATTPDILDRSMLANLSDWEPFFRGLKFVVLEQAQEYYGAFGANVAVLLRRMAHALAVLEANPRFFLVANGCANGRELAENLTGKEFEAAVARSGSLAKRHYLFIDPREAEIPARAELPDRVGRAVLACIESGKSVLVQGASARVTTDCYQATLALSDHRGAGKESIFLAEDGIFESRKLETDEEGQAPAARAVFTASVPTGMSDMDEFEGVILAGIPAAPRSGMVLMMLAGTRSREESFLILYPAATPEDTFFVHGLDALLDREPEQIVFDADHAEIVLPHLGNLGIESGGRIYSFSRDVLGNAIFQLLRRQAEELSAEEEFSPVEIDLKGSGEPTWSIWYEGETIAEFPPYRKFREAYPGAIINVGGVKYRYVSSDAGTRDGSRPRVTVENPEGIANLQTEPLFETGLAVQEESLCLALATGVSLNLGTVTVEEKLTRIRAFDDSSLPDREEDDPAGLEVTYTPEEEVSWRSVSPAFWVDIAGLAGEELQAGEGQDKQPVLPGMAALEQMLRLGARFTFPAGPGDLMTHSDGARVFLVEVGQGAQGLAKKAFDLWRGILETGASMARRCQCERGCVRCIVPPLSPSVYVDKMQGLDLADRLLDVTRAG